MSIMRVSLSMKSSTGWSVMALSGFKFQKHKRDVWHQLASGPGTLGEGNTYQPSYEIVEAPDKWKTGYPCAHCEKRKASFLQLMLPRKVKLRAQNHFWIIWFCINITVNSDISKIHHSDMKPLELLVSIEKKHNPKAETYVLLNGHSESFNTRRPVFQNYLQRSKGGTRIYRRFCNKDQVFRASQITDN